MVNAIQTILLITMSLLVIACSSYSEDDINKVSDKKSRALVYTYPDVNEIIHDYSVQAQMDEAWAETVRSATKYGRREFVFYVYYNVENDKFTCGPITEGAIISGCEGTHASIHLGKPTDNVACCAVFHCHTTLQYCPSDVHRLTGSSSGDTHFSSEYKLPGILYDYSSTTIYGGESKTAPHKIYLYGPTHRII